MRNAVGTALLCGIGGVIAAADPARIAARATTSGTSSGSSSLPTITVKGNAFFNGNDRFYIRGVDYQPGGSSQMIDPLADTSICMRDIPQMQQLGVNTVRVYIVDNSKNHDACMNALAAAGIYLALDVNSPNYSINRAKPGASYNPTYLQSVFATIDAFAKYSNTLLFFSGNEVISSVNDTNCAPYVKATTRDMKQYIGQRGYRSIPVGYAAADISQNQYLMAQYMDCGETASRSDFYSINNYEWCDPTTFDTSGWSSLVAEYSNYSLPLFFAEYGCITPNPRDFSEVPVLFSTQMTGVFSGGLVYQLTEEATNPGWGLVNVNGNTDSPNGDQFSLYQNALKNSPDPSGGGGYSTNGVVQQCPPLSDNWQVGPWTGSSLPATPSGAVQYFSNGAGAGTGLQGGSQDAGGGSSSTASAGAGTVTTTQGTPAASSSGSHSSTTSSTGLGPAQPGPSSGLLALVCGGVAFAFASFLFGVVLL